MSDGDSDSEGGLSRWIDNPHLVDFGDQAKGLIESLYLFVWDRPLWQQAILGIGIFLGGILLSDPIEQAFALLISLAPALGGMIPNGPLSTSNRMIVFFLGVVIIHQVRRFNRLEKKVESMSPRTDGGARNRANQPNSLPIDDDRGDGDDSPGGGAIGGAIAGAALGSAYGPGGTIGGAVLGAILGDSIAKGGDEEDERRSL